MALGPYYSAAEISLAQDMRMLRRMSWRAIGRAMRRDPSSLSKACGKIKRMGYGPITDDEIESARHLRALGKTWMVIGRELGRADGSGLRKLVFRRHPQCNINGIAEMPVHSCARYPQD